MYVVTYETLNKSYAVQANVCNRCLRLKTGNVARADLVNYLVSQLLK